MVVERVFHFSLDDIDETDEEGGEGFDGECTFATVEGFPFGRNARETGGGSVCSVCGLDVGVFDSEEVEVVVRVPLFL